MNNTRELFECEYCHSPFITERRVNNHICKQKKRYLDSKTLLGQTAFLYYQEWFRLKNMHLNKDVKTFLESRYYVGFINFVTFTKEMKINDYSEYIKFGINNRYQPPLWCHDVVYNEYLQYTLKQIGPQKQVEITIKWLDTMAGIHECTISEVLCYLSDFEIVEAIRLRRFLPWFFLNSVKFTKRIKNFPISQQKELFKIIDDAHWISIIILNEDISKEIKDLAKELNL